jgi:hypothetical protein
VSRQLPVRLDLRLQGGRARGDDLRDDRFVKFAQFQRATGSTLDVKGVIRPMHFEQ